MTEQPEPRVKIFGLQRSGTNYVRALLRFNYVCDPAVNDGGWKHGPLTWWDPSWHSVVIISKEPFAWLVSAWEHMQFEYKHRPFFTAETLGDFLTSPFIIEGSAPPQKQKWGVRASNPVQYWNNAYFHWSSITGIKGLHIRYTDLLADEEGVLKRIAKVLGLTRREGDLVHFDKILTPSDDRWVSTHHEKLFARKTYYLNREYMNQFTPEQAAWVLDQLDPGVVQKLGYSR